VPALLGWGLAAALLGGCGGGGLSRDQLEDRYIDTLIDRGIEPAVAECVISAFFGELTDDELRDFNTDGDELTPAQSARIGELAAECGLEA
jgi:hypothetical protein